MKFPVDKTLTIGQRDLINEDYSISWDWYDITTTRRCCHTCNLFSVNIQGLLNYVVKHWVKHFQASFVSTSKDSWNSPLTCQPTHSHQLKTSNCKHLLNIFFNSHLSHNWFSTLNSSRQKRFGSFLINTTRISTVSLSPFPSSPLLIFRFGISLFPLRNCSINSNRVQNSIIWFPLKISNDVGMIIDSSNLFKGVTIVNIDEMNTTFLRIAFLPWESSC